MIMERRAASISMISDSPNPSPAITSACVSSMTSSVLLPSDRSPTRFPTDVNIAFMIVTLFATNHSARPSLISIRRITSKRISSLTSTDSEQKPITKKSTTSDDPTATKIGSIPEMTAHGPPSLNSTGDCPKSPKTSDT